VSGSMINSASFPCVLRSSYAIHPSAWKVTACWISQHRAHCDYKSGSKSAKIGVFGAQSGVKADTKGVLQHAGEFSEVGRTEKERLNAVLCSLPG
jgi:hypothetical protein